MAEREEKERDDLRKRLRRLGLVRGSQALSHPSPRRRVAIESLIAGTFHETASGRCFVAELDFDLDHCHGELPLNPFLDLDSQLLATVGAEPNLSNIDLRKMVFMDTETTGLSGGSGTMAFLVGLGFFDGDRFRLLQPFLRDPGDEPSMVEFLVDLLPRFEGWVTFNGRAFDLPILENRFTLARQRLPMSSAPHLDLLGPARRMWSISLPSCSLGTLERQVLGVQRDQTDVPGGVIPELYRDYLRTGDASDIARIMYHNQIDILSMVTLATKLCRAFDSPWDDPDVSGTDLYALSRWYSRSEGDTERALRAALKSSLPGELRLRALSDLALHLKRTGRRSEAVAWWQQLALEDPTDVLAPIELAKTFEWHIQRLELALAWTKLALSRAEGWTKSPNQRQVIEEITHRQARLQRKREAVTPGSENA